MPAGHAGQARQLRSRTAAAKGAPGWRFWALLYAPPCRAGYGKGPDAVVGGRWHAGSSSACSMQAATGMVSD